MAISMQKIYLFKVVLVICFLFVVYTILISNYRNAPATHRISLSNLSFTKHITKNEGLTRTVLSKIIISFVVCGQRLNESLNVVKSALLFTRSPLKFIIFTEDVLKTKLENALDKLKIKFEILFEYEIHFISFPKQYEEVWVKLFRKCAAQRLFYPALLPKEHAVLYVDIDTIFLGPPEDLWLYFDKFNSSHISALVLEDENPNVSWYPRFAKHPFYGKYGLNSGVMLMNLTRMREFTWVDYLTPVMRKWRLDIPWGDQDIINIIFHYHPGRVLELPCQFNYRTDQCMYGNACAATRTHGVRLLHGSRGVFCNDKQPIFKVIYQAMDKFEPGSHTFCWMLATIKSGLRKWPATSCSDLKPVLLKTISDLCRDESLKQRLTPLG